MSIRNKLKQLRTVCTDPRWWPFYLQRRVMSHRWREKLSDLMAARRPACQAIGEESASARLRDELRGDGLALLGSLVDPAKCGDLERYFLSRPVHDPYRPQHPAFLPDSGERPQQAHIAHHDPADVVGAPGLLELANAPLILDAVGSLFGCKPTISYMAAWWSYHTGIGAQQAEHFHRDVDDWRFIKLFVYLSDVNPDNGPHVYVTQSAQSDRLRRIGRFTDEEVAACFPPGNFRTMTGRAGDAFLENTFGIHKGQPVRSGTRLVFQVVYSMFNLPYGPKRPVALFDSASRLDPWINRIYLGASR